ncbi:MAG: hypothetical protein WD512_15325 [Candidatus Paceibacterota bacterium]
MQYHVNYVSVQNSMPGIGIWNTPDDASVLVVSLSVKNISKDPQKEKMGFSLEDSLERRFTGIYTADRGDSLGVIQPGLSGKTSRYAIFTIPFEPDLEYKILTKDLVINLGKGASFQIDTESATKLAINTDDIGNCDLLDDNTQCISSYAKKSEDPKQCLNAADFTLCIKELFPQFGVSVCDSFQSGTMKSCKSNYVIFQDEKFRQGLSVPNYAKCRTPFDTQPGSSYCYLKGINQDLLTAKELFTLKSEDELVACKHLWRNGPDGKFWCTAAEAVYTKNVALCDNSGIAKIDCYYALALHDDSFTTENCDKLEKNVANTCYAYVAARTGDASKCKTIDPGWCDEIINRFKGWENMHGY